MDIFIIKINDQDCELLKDALQDFRYKEISNPRKLFEHCLTYLMLDRILEDFYSIEDRTLDFINGKPFLKSNLKKFSISHSNDYIVLAFSDFDCGIDIEKNKLRDFSPIAKRMKFPECQTLGDFYTAWTTYEAEYKLAKPYNSATTWLVGDYTLTAVSENPDEHYKVFMELE